MQMTQAHVAAQAGVSSDTLSRLERGSLSEIGTRKLLAVLSVLGAELAFSHWDRLHRRIKRWMPRPAN